MDALIHNPTFWVGVSFAILLLAALKMKVPSTIAKSLDDRAVGIRKELDDARKFREEAQALLADYQRKHREAEDEAKSIVEQARREAESLTAETRKNLAESLERRTKLAEEKIARAEAQAIGEVRAAAVEAATSAAERILVDRSTGAAGATLVDQSIAQLKSKLN
jgi:F-type H+-transporting ATPase subunit b